MSGDEHDGDLNDIGEHSGGDDNLNPDADDKADADDNADAAAVGEVSGARWVDVSALPGQVADAIELLIGQAVGDGPVAADITGPRVSRERLGDVIQAAETVKAFGDASLLGATAALVEDVAVDHGVPADDPRFAAKVAVYRKQACRAVVHEVQLLTGSTLTSARDRVRFATALPQRVGRARELLRSGSCSWERARIAYSETAHLDPVLAGEVIDRLLAPPERTRAGDGGEAAVPLSHSGFRARIRRQLALIDGTAPDADRRHAAAVESRDACTFPGRDGSAMFQASGDAARVFTAQQRVADLAKAARAAGDPRTLAQLRADIALDLLIKGDVLGHDLLGDAPAGRLHVIVPFAAILPDGAFGVPGANPTGGTGAATASRTTRAAAGTAFGLGEVPGLGFLTPAQLREVAVAAGSTWARLVTDPVSGVVIDAANTYRAPAGMSRLVKGRDHTCRAPGDCGVSAAESDLDHDTEYVPGATDPGRGATHPDNLHAAHRGHHNAKTGRFWASDQHQDASISWCTLTRRLRTTPFDHHRADDHSPPRLSWVEQQFGIRLALCREHDLVPNVFTDLEDLHLLTGTGTGTGTRTGTGDDVRAGDDGQECDDGREAQGLRRQQDPPADTPKPAEVWNQRRRQIRGTIQCFTPFEDIRIEFPDPPPPF